MDKRCFHCTAILIRFVLVGTIVFVGSSRRTTLATKTQPDSLQHVEPTSTPRPLPHDCDGTTPPGGVPPACCAYGYIYHQDAPVAGANVAIESPNGTRYTTTIEGGISSEPYYSVDLSSTPLLVSPGDVVTITASYSDMVSARTWTVQSDGQQVDLGLVTGYQAPSPTPTMAMDIHDSTSTIVSEGAQMSALSQRIPLTFIENVGQFDEHARFQVRSGNTTLFLANDACE